MIIHISDYLKDNDASYAVYEALQNCKDGDTLCLDGKTLEIDNSYAVPTYYYLPRYSNLCKYYAFYLSGRKNLTIDGGGAKLLFKGDVSAFGVEDCENITFKNFSIDYVVPYFWQAKIIKAQEDFFEVEFDKENFPCKYDSFRKTFVFGNTELGITWEDNAMLANEFEEKPCRMTPNSPDYFFCLDKPHPVYTSMSTVFDCEVVSDNCFRFNHKEGKKIKHTVGNYFVCASHERRNNNFHFNRTKNIVMENINMYHSISFGCIFLLCENIKIENVNSLIKPDSGRMLAVNADVFHCVNIRGNIEISDCTMENMKDDAINVHSLYAVVEKQVDEHTLILKFVYLAKKALNIFLPEDKIYFLTADSFEKYGGYTVEKSELAGNYHLRLTVKEKLEKVTINDLVESETGKPTVYIHNCRAGNNRGRGFLLTAGNKTLVEDCTLYCSRFAIDGNGASYTYLEGAAVNGLTVRRCNFEGAAYADGIRHCAIHLVPQDIKNREKPYHNNIVIEDNKFSSGTPIILTMAENVCIRNNSDLNEDKSDTVCILDKCENVVVEK